MRRSGKAIIDRQTEPWGIKVGTVELKDAQLAEPAALALLAAPVPMKSAATGNGASPNGGDIPKVVAPAAR